MMERKKFSIIVERERGEGGDVENEAGGTEPSDGSKKFSPIIKNHLNEIHRDVETSSWCAPSIGSMRAFLGSNVKLKVSPGIQDRFLIMFCSLDWVTSSNNVTWSSIPMYDDEIMISDDDPQSIHKSFFYLPFIRFVLCCSRIFFYYFWIEFFWLFNDYFFISFVFLSHSTDGDFSKKKRKRKSLLLMMTRWGMKDKTR